MPMLQSEYLWRDDTTSSTRNRSSSSPTRNRSASASKSASINTASSSIEPCASATSSSPSAGPSPTVIISSISRFHPGKPSCSSATCFSTSTSACLCTSSFVCCRTSASSWYTIRSSDPSSTPPYSTDAANGPVNCPWSVTPSSTQA